MSAINTDLYELTMAAGYFATGKMNEVATFELIVRRLPENRNFLLAAGLAQAVDYLQTLHFDENDVEYLRSLPHFQRSPLEFFEFLRQLHFTGDLYAMPEGTPVFANEPIAIVRAPIVQAQLVETFLLSTFAYQTTIASKAARCVLAAEGRPVVEFGSRRAHSPEAGVLAGRAAYLGGCTGTSNTLSGKRFGIPVFGTAAHSWTMSFGSEEESFRALQSLLGENTVLLIDTYNTIEGARLATKIGMPLWGVRLDSGDISQLSRQVRQILDNAGMQGAKIFATNDLDEHRVAELIRTGAPIDAFGVGTQLATSADAPALSAVYKLVELRRGEDRFYAAKFSDEKSTLPGAKQVFRMNGFDIIALAGECNDAYSGEPLLRPILIGGHLTEKLPTLAVSRTYAANAIAKLAPELRQLTAAPSHRVDLSQKLRTLSENLRRQHQLVSC